MHAHASTFLSYNMIYIDTFIYLIISYVFARRQLPIYLTNDFQLAANKARLSCKL